MVQRSCHLERSLGQNRKKRNVKGNAAYAAMEAVTAARGWQDDAKRACDMKYAETAEAEVTYHATIRLTLERTEVLEKHVKTVTMRADTLVTTETDFSQTLIKRQEETIQELNTLYDQFCQPRSTRW